MRKLDLFHLFRSDCLVATSDLLFVYGTLRKADPSGRSELLGDAPISATGKVAGRLVSVGSYPGAVPDEEGWIVGELIQLADFEEQISLLDAYEGCDEATARPWEYRRELTRVFCDDGEERAAWIYWYAWPAEALEIIPSGDWLEHLRSKSGEASQKTEARPSADAGK